MLILNRSTNQTLEIGDNVTVRILGVIGDQVRLGIDAPRDTPVHRSEVLDRINTDLDRLRIYEIIGDPVDGAPICEHIAATNEKEAIAHFRTLHGNHWYHAPECTAVAWSPELRQLGAHLNADHSTYQALRNACMLGRRHPFVIELPEQAA